MTSQRSKCAALTDVAVAVCSCVRVAFSTAGTVVLVAVLDMRQQLQDAAVRQG